MRAWGIVEFTTWTALLVAILGAGFFVLLSVFPSLSGGDSSTERDQVFTRDSAPGGTQLLDGTYVEGKAEFPYAVMIDNRPEARPQYGLGDAFLVYETLVEGGATRYLAFFQNVDVSRIGPVRSARDYFVPWVAEMHAAFVHSGGSPQALAAIKLLSIYDVEEISYLGTQYFWRDADRPEPHNLFTSSSMVRGALEYLEYPVEMLPVSIWDFSATGEVLGQKVARVADKLAVLLVPYGDDEPVAEEPKKPLPPVRQELDVDSVQVDWAAGDAYDVAFEYDVDSGAYVRSLAGEAHVDGIDGEQIAVSNIVVLRLPKKKR